MDCFVAFFVLSHLLLHSSAEDDKRSLPICPPYFQCKSHLRNLPLTRNTGRPPLLSFPFTNNSYPACGLEINCDEEVATVKIGTERSYNVSDINTDDNNAYLVCHDPEFEHHLAAEDCDATFKSLALYSNLNTISFISLDKFNTRYFFKCNDSLAQNSQRTEAFFIARGYKSYKNCQDKGYSVYYMYPEEDTLSPPDVPSQCSSILLPVSSPGSQPLVDADNPFDVLSANITLTLTVSADCLQCRSNGSQCLNVDQGRYNCAIINGAGISTSKFPVSQYQLVPHLPDFNCYSIFF